MSGLDKLEKGTQGFENLAKLEIIRKEFEELSKVIAEKADAYQDYEDSIPDSLLSFLFSINEIVSLCSTISKVSKDCNSLKNLYSYIYRLYVLFLELENSSSHTNTIIRLKQTLTSNLKNKILRVLVSLFKEKKKSLVYQKNIDVYTRKDKLVDSLNRLFGF
jgi:hypothetical protein